MFATPERSSFRARRRHARWNSESSMLPRVSALHASTKKSNTSYSASSGAVARCTCRWRRSAARRWASGDGDMRRKPPSSADLRRSSGGRSAPAGLGVREGPAVMGISRLLGVLAPTSCVSRAGDSPPTSKRSCSSLRRILSSTASTTAAIASDQSSSFAAAPSSLGAGDAGASSPSPARSIGATDSGETRNGRPQQRRDRERENDHESSRARTRARVRPCGRAA